MNRDHVLGRTRPFGIALDTPVRKPASPRRLADLAGLFADEEARKAAADRVVYRVDAAPVPEQQWELPFSITTVEPGDVSGELFMTRGHVHETPDGEMYYGLSGHGVLLLFDGTGASWVEMRPGAAGYIPPGWAHRSVNVGIDPYRFLAAYPGSAGHDYDAVLRDGMGARVFRDGGGFAVLDAGGNPVPEAPRHSL